MFGYLKDIDFYQVWLDLVSFSDTLIGAIVFSIFLVSFLSICVKIGLMVVTDKIGIIKHLKSKQLEKLKAMFDLVALCSNMFLGVLVSDYYNRPIPYGITYGLTSIFLHWYVETGRMGDNLGFILKNINPKTLLRKYISK